MIAYIYRSGHVGISRHLPTGAYELANHEDESTLLKILQWIFPLVEDSEGCPTMADPELIRCGDSILAKRRVTQLQQRISAALQSLHHNPPLRYHVGPLEPWELPPSSEPSKYSIPQPPQELHQSPSPRFLEVGKGACMVAPGLVSQKLLLQLTQADPSIPGPTFYDMSTQAKESLGWPGFHIDDGPFGSKPEE